MNKSKLNLLLISLSSAFSLNAAPSITSSIYPVQQIADTISGQKTELIVKSHLSPHTYQVKPSDIDKIESSDLFIWVGPSLLPQLNQAVKRREKNTLTLIAQDSIKTLDYSHDHNHDDHNHDDHNHDDHNHDDHNHNDHNLNTLNKDPHIWLSTQNAAAIADSIYNELIKLDAENQATYKTNLDNFKIELEQADQTIKSLIEPIKNKPYYVFHDAYAYFEKHYNIKHKGVIKLNPSSGLTSKTLVSIQDDINKNKDEKPCLFYEPQFDNKVVKRLSEDNNVKLAKLDPIGYDVQSQGFPLILINIATSLNSCLK